MPALYSKLLGHFGFLDWWPGETKDEILIGAILTQHTSWKNVEKSIYNLKRAKCISIDAISSIGAKKLERLIKPSGFYKSKAKSIKSVSAYILSKYGTINGMHGRNTRSLRLELLGIHGIGKETSDSILLYAADKKIFVIDAYTRRAIERIYGHGKGEGYEALQSYIASQLPSSLRLYKDFHAQFVELCKNYCRTKPLCNKCPVKSYCKYYRSPSA